MKLFVSFLLELCWFVWRKTIRFEIQGLELVESEIQRGHVPVFAVPHHTILLSALSYANRPATLLASRSSDGEIAARFMKKRGFEVVRGSSSRGGKEALAELKSAITLGQPVAITFDGPRGPRLVPKPGIAVCAWHASGSLFLLKVRVLPSKFAPAGLCVYLNSWDRFIVPIPFCRVQIFYDQLELPAKDDLDSALWITQTLSVLRAKTESFYQTETSPR